MNTKCQLAVAAPVLLYALLMSSTTTLADPTTLVCNNDTRPDLGPISVDLNQAQGTVTENAPARSVPNGDLPPIDMPAASNGPFPAKFDAKTISFDRKVNDQSYWHITIDRVTGVLLWYSSDFAPWDEATPENRAMFQYSCHVGQTQF